MSLARGRWRIPPALPFTSVPVPLLRRVLDAASAQHPQFNRAAYRLGSQCLVEEEGRAKQVIARWEGRCLTRRLGQRTYLGIVVISSELSCVCLYRHLFLCINIRCCSSLCSCVDSCR